MLENDARDRVIVALDCDRERALELAHALSGHAAWLKDRQDVQGLGL